MLVSFPYYLGTFLIMIFLELAAKKQKEYQILQCFLNHGCTCVGVQLKTSGCRILLWFLRIWISVAKTQFSFAPWDPGDLSDRVYQSTDIQPPALQDWIARDCRSGCPPTPVGVARCTGTCTGRWERKKGALKWQKNKHLLMSEKNFLNHQNFFQK